MAGSPGGKSVGRVSIRVVPDSTRFKADLQKSLERIEKSTTFQLPLGIDTRDAELELKKFVKDWNGKGVNIDVDAETGAATAHLAEFTRRRSVDVSVNLNKRALAQATTALAALSGGRVLQNSLRNIFTQLSNLDTALPKIAAVGLAVGSIGSLALSSVGGLFTMTAALSSLASLGAVLPSMFAAAAVGATVLIVALKDAGTQLSSLNPLWKQLQSTIQTNFWAKAKQPILDLVNGVFPQLKAGLGTVSTAMGAWAGSVAGSFQKAFGGGVLQGLMNQLAQAITNSTKGTDAFAQSIATLGRFGGQYLPAIGQWFSDISVQFNNWLSRVASDGTLKGWVSSAMTVLQQLGAVIGSVVSIFGSIFKAAQAAGSSGLDTLVNALQNIAAIVATPAFQSTLTTVFEGAAAGVHGLMTALGPISGLIGSLAPTISVLLSSIGQAVGGALSAIAGALSSPAFAQGLTALFAGLEIGIKAIEPSLPAVAEALGTIGQVAGTLAAQIGPILGTALQALAPVIVGVLQAVQPLIPVLGNLLVQGIQILAPLLQAVVPIFAALVPVVSQVVTALAPLFGAALPIIIQLVQILTPVIQQFASMLSLVASAIAPIVAALLPPLMSLFQQLIPFVQQVASAFMQIFTAVGPIITAILPPLMGLFQALMPVVQAIFGAFMALLTPILKLIAPLLQLIGPILAPLIKLFTVLMTTVLSPLAPILKALTPLFNAVGQIISDLLLPVVKTITTVLKGLIDFLTGVFTGNWKKAWNGIVEIFSGIWNGIIDIAKGTINGMIDLINGIIGSVNNVTSKIGIPAIPKIPRLATGGDVEASQGGTLVVLGEGGKAETVTNRGLTNQMIENTNALLSKVLAGGVGGGRPDVNIYTQETDGRIIGRQAAREFMRALAG
jgi:phage-related protein